MSATPAPIDYTQLAAEIKRWAREFGFADAGITDIDLSDAAQGLDDYLAAGHHGGMQWMAERAHMRVHPEELHPGTLRIICVRMDYAPPEIQSAWDVIHDDSLAYISRMTRSVMLDQLSREYVLTARLKGASEFTVVVRHALGNAAIPLLTVIALSYGGLLEGSVLVETIFAWPGIGNYIYSSLFAADMNAVLGGTLLVGIVFVLLNMLSDVLYAVLDPRSRSLRA